MKKDYWKRKEKYKKSIEDYIVENTKNLIKKYKITEMGIAIPGTISNGVIVKSVNLGLENYNIVEELKEKINIPIKSQNDAKCAAIAEKRIWMFKKNTKEVYF